MQGSGSLWNETRWIAMAVPPLWQIAACGERLRRGRARIRRTEKAMKITAMLRRGLPVADAIASSLDQ